MSVASAKILRDARHAAGLTQTQLAERLGTSQSAVAQAERPTANPRLDTLERMLRASGFDLEVRTRKRPPAGVDLSQIRERLRLTPRGRLDLMTASHANVERMRRLAGVRRYD